MTLLVDKAHRALKHARELNDTYPRDSFLLRRLEIAEARFERAAKEESR